MNRLRLFLPLALCGLLGACKTDELCYVHPHPADITVLYDWSDAPEADPEGMRTWFYPLDIDGFEPQVRDWGGTAGGAAAHLITGTYHIVSHNNDSELLTFEGTTDHSFHAVRTSDAGILDPMTRAGSVSDSGLDTGDERVASTPGPIWLASLDNVAIADGDTVTLTPRQIHCRYTFEFLNVGDTRGLVNVSASISGMSGGIRLSDGNHTGETVTHPLEVRVDEKEHRIYGEFHTFGYPPASTRTGDTGHRMALYVVLSDGRKLKYTEGDHLDVTSQVRLAPDPKNVHIVIEGLELPATVGSGGFDPTVEDWEEENHDIIL